MDFSTWILIINTGFFLAAIYALSWTIRIQRKIIAAKNKRIEALTTQLKNKKGSSVAEKLGTVLKSGLVANALKDIKVPKTAKVDEDEWKDVLHEEDKIN